jgi:hypothetical protein
MLRGDPETRGSRPTWRIMSDDRVGKGESAQGRRWKEKRSGTLTAGLLRFRFFRSSLPLPLPFVRRFLSFVSLHGLLLFCFPARPGGGSTHALSFICILRGGRPDQRWLVIHPRSRHACWCARQRWHVGDRTETHLKRIFVMGSFITLGLDKQSSKSM